MYLSNDFDVDVVLFISHSFFEWQTIGKKTPLMNWLKYHLLWKVSEFHWQLLMPPLSFLSMYFVHISFCLPCHVIL